MMRAAQVLVAIRLIEFVPAARDSMLEVASVAETPEGAEPNVGCEKRCGRITNANRETSAPPMKYVTWDCVISVFAFASHLRHW